MRQHYIIIDGDGLVEAAGFGVAPEGAVIVGSQMSPFDLSRLYVDGENGLVPRPEAASPTIDGDDLSLPSGPEGTRLRVVDRVSDEIMWEQVTDGELAAYVLTLPDAGTYIVDIAPPPPWLPVQVEFVK